MQKLGAGVDDNAQFEFIVATYSGLPAATYAVFQPRNASV
jgi:hypothetical protein